MDRVSTDFTFHVSRDPKRIRITFQTTVPSAPALGASGTSSRPPGLADSDCWHRSRAQSACQSTAAVRGGEQSRPSPSPLRCSRCAARLPHIETDVERRLTAIRRVWSKDSCLSDCLAECSLSANLRVHGACMVGRACWCGTMCKWRRSRLSSIEYQRPSGRGPEVLCHSNSSSACGRRLRGCTVVHL